MRRINRKIVTTLMVFTAIAMVFAFGCTKNNENNGSNGSGNNGGNGYNSHEYVDLGLPSGTLWAVCNVGATSPEGFGNLFAWGETSPKETYNWENYKWCTDEVIGFGIDEEGTLYRLTKYCDSMTFNGYNGYHDTLTVLQPSDDAATANWGGGWYTPTPQQWHELFDETVLSLTFQNGVKGILLTARNGNTLFLPPVDDYWSSKCYSRKALAYCYGDFGLWREGRCLGCAVRPVRSSN